MVYLQRHLVTALVFSFSFLFHNGTVRQLLSHNCHCHLFHITCLSAGWLTNFHQCAIFHLAVVSFSSEVAVTRLVDIE